jgi:hypothetical protein
MLRNELGVVFAFGQVRRQDAGLQYAVTPRTIDDTAFQTTTDGPRDQTAGSYPKFGASQRSTSAIVIPLRRA